MRKEKNQIKTNDLSLTETLDMKKARLTIKKLQQTPVNYNTEKQQQQQQQIRFDHQPR
jgi:hypothetical protein